MAITRVKPAGWAVNEKLTSAQQNALDLNVTYALDKRTGEVDTLSSFVEVDSTGVISFKNGSNLILDGYSTTTIASDDVTVISGGKITFNANSDLEFLHNSRLTFGGIAAITSEATIGLLSPDVYGSINGGLTFNSGFALTFGNATIIAGTVTGSLTFKSGFALTFGNPTTLSGTVTGSLTMNSDFDLNVDGDFSFSENHSSTYSAGSAVVFGPNSIISFGNITTGTYVSGYWAGNLVLKSPFSLEAEVGTSATLSALKLIGTGNAGRVGFDSPKNIVRWLQPIGEQNTTCISGGEILTKPLVSEDPCFITIPIVNIPNTAQLTKITIYYRPFSGHGALPAVMPTFELFKKDSSSTSSPTQLGSTATDTAASVAIYETGMRSLSVTVSEIVDTTTYRYVATFVSEWAADSLPLMKIHGAKVEYTTSYMDEC